MFEEILKYMGLWDDLNADGKITFGSNVKEVTSQVAAAAVIVVLSITRCCQ
ncbi:MAG: hypothetical protein ACLUB2_03285 [Butyricicoccus pullicaecorum]